MTRVTGFCVHRKENAASRQQKTEDKSPETSSEVSARSPVGGRCRGGPVCPPLWLLGLEQRRLADVVAVGQDVMRARRVSSGDNTQL